MNFRVAQPVSSFLTASARSRFFRHFQKNAITPPNSSTPARLLSPIRNPTAAGGITPLDLAADDSLVCAALVL